MNATGLDTNILARYFVAAGSDPAEQRQVAEAVRLVDSGMPLQVCKTVLLELEWVLRGFYHCPRDKIEFALRHLVTQPHIFIEDRRVVERALENFSAGLDFADALHHASYADCASVASFDDRGFVRRARKLGLQPSVKLPKAP